MSRLAKALAAIVLVMTGAALFVYGGVYNVAGDEPHWKATSWLLETLRERSIAVRSADTRAPNLDDAKQIEAGARLYAQMCVGCHLAPGVPDTALRAGLNPPPPELASHHSMEPRAAFWIVKHGIKASGMPAWGNGHDDRELWSIVAFVKQLPALDAERYGQLSGPAAAEHGHR